MARVCCRGFDTWLYRAITPMGRIDMSLNHHDRDSRRLLKKCLRISLRIVAGAALLAACSYAVLVGLNWNDRPAGAAAQKLAKAFDAAPALPDDKNAYVYMTGFSVEQSADPFEWGVKRIRWANLNRS